MMNQEKKIFNYILKWENLFLKCTKIIQLLFEYKLFGLQILKFDFVYFVVILDICVANFLVFYTYVCMYI